MKRKPKQKVEKTGFYFLDEDSEKKAVDTSTREGFVLYPPTGDLTDEQLSDLRAYVSGWKLHRVKTDYFNGNRVDFRKTGNPLHAMAALLETDRIGFYPPMWVIRWLVDGFKKFEEQKGKGSLQAILGFRVKQGQRLNLIEKNQIKNRNVLFISMVLMLKALGVKMMAGFNAVAKKHKRISEGDLKKEFFRMPKSERNHIFESWKKEVSSWTELERQFHKNYYLQDR